MNERLLCERYTPDTYRIPQVMDGTITSCVFSSEYIEKTRGGDNVTPSTYCLIEFKHSPSESTGNYLLEEWILQSVMEGQWVKKHAHLVAKPLLGDEFADDTAEADVGLAIVQRYILPNEPCLIFCPGGGKNLPKLSLCYNGMEILHISEYGRSLGKAVKLNNFQLSDTSGEWVQNSLSFHRGSRFGFELVVGSLSSHGSDGMDMTPHKILFGVELKDYDMRALFENLECALASSHKFNSRSDWVSWFKHTSLLIEEICLPYIDLSDPDDEITWITI